MADNLTYTTTVATVPDATVVATRLVSHAGDTANFQGVFPVYISGSEGAYTVNEVYHLEDTAHSTGAAGPMVLAVRNDTLAALAGTDGDYAPLQVNASGAQYVQIAGTEAALDVSGATVTVTGTVTANLGTAAVTNAGTFAVQEDGAALTALQLIDDVIYVDDTATHTAATSKVAGIGVVAVPTDTTVDANDIAMPGMSTDRRLWVDAQIVGTDAALDVSGATVTVTGTVTANLGTANVTNAGTFAVQVDGNALTALQLIDDPVFADDAAFTLASSKVMVAGAIRDDALSTLTAIEGDAVPLRVSSTGALHVTGAGGGTQYAVDDALGATPTGTLAIAIRDDALSTLTPVEGDAIGLRVDSTGRLWASVTIDTALPAGTNAIGKLAANSGVDIGDVDILSLPASTNTLEVVGDVARDAAAAGNPVHVGGQSVNTDDTAPPTRVDAESDRTVFATDWDGSVFARPHGPQVWSYHSNGSTALTDATVHDSPGAGLSLYVTDIVFSSGAATAINAFFEESTTTVLGPYYLEAVAGRGMHIQFQTPKKIQAATALTVTTSASIAHSIDVTGFVGAA